MAWSIGNVTATMPHRQLDTVGLIVTLIWWNGVAGFIDWNCRGHLTWCVVEHGMWWGNGLEDFNYTLETVHNTTLLY
jgi:hypothetical protein